MQYDVFISYSRKDTEVANRICKAFEEVGITYFIDRQGISGGFEFPTVLAEAIINCKIFLYLASKNSYESRFTQSEITFAFNEKPKGRILPYIIDDSTMPPALRFVFSNINWRCLEKHPINTVLVDDLLHLLEKERLIIPDNKIIIPKIQYKKVDLGLSVYWAEHNVGASSPEEYGDFFAWGETEPKSEYTIATYKYYDKTKEIYINIGDDISGTKYDVARAKWNGNWRMPRLDEIKEIEKKCSWQWAEINGAKGYKVIGPNGNSIFLPAASNKVVDPEDDSIRRFFNIDCRGSHGHYWSATLHSYFSNRAIYLYFRSGNNFSSSSSRFYGLTVRPVIEK